MKKVWNAPDMQELTIQSTACWGWKPGWKPGWQPGCGDSNLCRCEGGTSPCEKHHGFGGNDDDDTTGDDLS